MRADRANPRRSCEFRHSRAVELITTDRLHPGVGLDGDGDRMPVIEPEVRSARMLETSDEKPGPNEQYHRQRHLTDQQPLAES